MKNSIFLLFLSPTILFSQRDIINEYKDKGKIESIEYSCQEGKFKKDGTFKFARDLGANCAGNSIQKFDKDGHLIYSEYPVFTQSMNGAIVHTVLRISNIEYQADSIFSTKYYLQETGAEAIYEGMSYQFVDKSGGIIDSIYDAENELTARHFSKFDSLGNFSCSIYTSEDGKSQSFDTTYYDSSGREKKHIYIFQTDEDIDSQIWYYSHNDSISRSYQLAGEDTVNYNYNKFDSNGLVVVYIYRPKKNSDAGYYRHTYSYVFDEKGNWTEKWVYDTGFLIAIERRKITYYSE